MKRSLVTCTALIALCPSSGCTLLVSPGHQGDAGQGDAGSQSDAGQSDAAPGETDAGFLPSGCLDEDPWGDVTLLRFCFDGPAPSTLTVNSVDGFRALSFEKPVEPSDGIVIEDNIGKLEEGSAGSLLQVCKEADALTVEVVFRSAADQIPGDGEPRRIVEASVGNAPKTNRFLVGLSENGGVLFRGLPHEPATPVSTEAERDVYYAASLEGGDLSFAALIAGSEVLTGSESGFTSPNDWGLTEPVDIAVGASLVQTPPRRWNGRLYHLAIVCAASDTATLAARAQEALGVSP